LTTQNWYGTALGGEIPWLLAPSRPSVILGARPEVNLALIPEPKALSPITNPGAALRAVIIFFDERRILSGDEFYRILREARIRDDEQSSLLNVRFSMFGFFQGDALICAASVLLWFCYALLI
jgi:hypothetical protein